MEFRMLQVALTEKLKTKNAYKRLSAISGYLYENFEIEISPSAPPEQYLYQIVQLIRDNSEQESDIISDLFMILNDRYSNGEPYFFSDFSTTLTSSQIIDLILAIFDNTTVNYDAFDFELEKQSFDDINNTAEIKVRYKEWFINTLTGIRERELNSGTICLHFDITNKVCLSSQIGYNKVYSKLISFITDNSSDLYIKHEYIQKETRYMKNSSTSQFSALTLLTLHLIFIKVNALGFNVQSVDSISFNNENAPRVKNAKLGGTDLLQDPDVIERIYNGDKITKFTVSLFKINKDDDGEERAIVTALTIDFRSILKFNFDESGYTEVVIRKVCKELYSGIKELLNSEDTIEKGEDILRKNITKTNRYTQGSLYNVLAKVKEDLIKKLNSNEEIQNAINTYFKENYNIN